ncbi:putative ribonuclease H-like domain-containing protein [Tanacetum coccineum]
MGSISYFSVASPNSSPNGSVTKNGSEQVGNTSVNVVPSSHSTKLRPTSSIITNLHKLEANVPNDADYDVWLPLDSVHEVNDGMKKLYGYFIGKRLSFPVVEWFSPPASLLKEDLSHVLVWVKFHDVPLVAYTSDGLSLIATKIGTLMMLDSYTNSMCLESWRRSIYAIILIKIEAFNDFSDNLVMAMPNLKGTGYTKETICKEYEWKPSHCSTCLIFGHSLDDCLKAPKLVVNKMDKGNGGSFVADDKGFIEVEKKKSGGNNEGNKNFKLVLVKPKPQYCPKLKQSTEGANQKTTHYVGKKNVSTSCNSTFYLSNLFKALNVENSVSEEVETGNKASTYGDSEDEIESVDNEMESYSASKPSGLDMDTPDNIQSICDNLDTKVRGRRKK